MRRLRISGELQHGLDLVGDHARRPECPSSRRRRRRPPARRHGGRSSACPERSPAEFAVRATSASREAPARGPPRPSAGRRRDFSRELARAAHGSPRRACARSAHSALERRPSSARALVSAASISAMRSSSAAPRSRSRISASFSCSSAAIADLRVLDRRRLGVLADGDARAGGVEQAHRLVGQLAGGDVAAARD